ncbi:MAG: hypothetical protein QNJ69_09720 [Gammaproteobacteria bacterium]|nr:hypothetical protein [Gammaproteobacteria bacterium]
MKLALIIVASVTLLGLILMFFTADKPVTQQAVNLPWQINLDDPEHSEVFGIELNKTTLEQARQHFGKLEGIGLYRDPEGHYSLEAYFGKVTLGPFSARIIANLAAPQAALEELTGHTVKRVKTDDGSLRWTLTEQKQAEQGLRQIQSLTYIPGYSGMDADFIEQRFGLPSRRKAIDETTELWFYPELGLRVMVDSEGKEMFEYTVPAQFEMILGDR